ncbi:MAG TPA: DUF3857 domain-containing protein, partial [Bacteroidales bacterium]|nr:DUF3857 domain-containing protein [Bacteroidales bacterium]
YQYLSEVPRDILFLSEIVEYVYEENALVQYELMHHAHLLTTDEAVNDNNKLYISISERKTLVDVKIRILSPNGSVREDKSPSLLSSIDEESGQSYSYFAIDGISKGDIVEYMYITRRDPRYNGTMKTFQRSDPVREYHFLLRSPSNLIFKFKTYSTDAEVVRDTNVSGYNQWSLAASNLPGIPKEDFCPTNLISARLIYKLDQNTYNGARDISSYGSLSQNLFKNLRDLTKGEEKTILKFLKEQKIPSEAATEDRIVMLEQGIKNTIRLDDVEGSDDAEEAIRTLLASDFGMVKIYLRCLEEMGIKYEVVLTGDRNYARMDETFESLNFLTDYFLYFPETDAFLAPNSFAYRYGIIPEEFTDNNGLFIREKKLGDMITGVGKIKYIPPSPYGRSFHDLDIKVKMSEDMGAALIELENSMGGHFGSGVHAHIPFVDEHRKEEIVKNMSAGMLKNLELDSWELIHATKDAIGRKPLILRLKGKDASLIQKAGDQYLFKVGELIGPQVEIYSEDKRKTPLYSDYKRRFTRVIRFEIPEGYRVVPPEGLRMFEEYTKDGNQVLLFQSEYIIEGNLLTINIQEFYDQLWFDLPEYGHYRRVVNAAADFNKLVLVMEKK